MTRAKAKPTSDMSAWESDIDVEATRKLVSELQTEGKPWDKLESSDKKYIVNYRRICPKRPEWENPYQIVPVHYLGPQGRMAVCLKEAGLGECPACTLRWELNDAGAEAESRQLRASIRTFLNVLRVDKNGDLTDDKVYLLGLNQLQFLGKRGVEYDPEEESELPLFGFFEKYGDLSHVVEGRDLLIKAKDEKSGDYNIQHLKFAVAPPSPFPGTSELLEKGLTALPEVVAVITPEEIVATIEGRATGAIAIGPPGDTPQIEAPAVTPAAEVEEPASRFGGAEEAEEDTATEATEVQTETSEESEDADARASVTPPKTDPAAAIARLRKNQNKE